MVKLAASARLLVQARCAYSAPEPDASSQLPSRPDRHQLVPAALAA